MPQPPTLTTLINKLLGIKSPWMDEILRLGGVLPSPGGAPWNRVFPNLETMILRFHVKLGEGRCYIILLVTVLSKDKLP